MPKLNAHNGFTLIELLIVVAIIGALAAIAIPGYLGMQDRGRIGGVSKGLASAVPELQAWILAAQNGKANNKWVDTNGSGSLGPLSNADLAEDYVDDNGLCTTYVATRPEKSPWGGSIDLWQAVAPGNGFISCTHPANGKITLEARDYRGNVILIQTVSAD